MAGPSRFSSLRKMTGCFMVSGDLQNTNLHKFNAFTKKKIA